MRIVWHNCKNCNYILPNAGIFYICNNCKSFLCDICGYEALEKFGESKQSDSPDFCQLCKGEKVTDKEFIKYICNKFNLTRDEIEKEIVIIRKGKLDENDKS